MQFQICSFTFSFVIIFESLFSLFESHQSLCSFFPDMIFFTASINLNMYFAFVVFLYYTCTQLEIVIHLQGNFSLHKIGPSHQRSQYRREVVLAQTAFSQKQFLLMEILQQEILLIKSLFFLSFRFHLHRLLYYFWLLWIQNGWILGIVHLFFQLIAFQSFHKINDFYMI